MLSPLHITASTAVSAIGHTPVAMIEALASGRSGLKKQDFQGFTAGCIGAVAGVEDHVLPSALQEFTCRNNLLADLAIQTGSFTRHVAAAVARHGADRIALVVGTSTSGVLSGEEAYRARGKDGVLPGWFNHRRTQDLSSLADFAQARLGLRGPVVAVSTACSSGSRAVVDAWHLIQAGLCDAAVVGGVDSLCRMTLEGFASLDLVAAGPCRPCDEARDGVSIGEAACFVLLETDGPADAPRITGHGESSDAHHMSAPHPEGLGAQDAMRQAMRRAGCGPDEIDWVKMHGTGTRANDAMESAAIHALFGDRVPASSLKGWLGHTLGACGLVEVLLAAEAMRIGLLPGCLGARKIDPLLRANIRLENDRKTMRRAMCNAFGFGGNNCSLIVESGPGQHA